MKIAIFVVGFVVAIIVVLIIGVFVIGSRLPQGHSASRSIRLNRPLPKVYAVVRDFGSSAAWRTDVKNVEMLDKSDNGSIRFRENGSNGAITYELLNDEPNQRIVTKIADRDLGYSGTWTYEFSSADTGTTVTITENGEVPNVLFRFMSRYIFGHTASIDTYLKALANHLDGSEI